MGIDPRQAEMKSSESVRTGDSTPENDPDIDEEEEAEGDQGEEEAGDGSEGGGEGEAGEIEEESKEVAVAVPGGPKKKLTNQFNFCERAALTYNNPSRVSFLELLIIINGSLIRMFIVIVHSLLKLKLFHHHVQHLVQMLFNGTFMIRTTRTLSDSNAIKKRKC